MQRGYLILANGQVFEGERFGKTQGDVMGELVFTTAMTGYIETLTDPSYYGQLVLQTFPLIGNVGIIPEDFERDAPRLSAYLVRDLCAHASNFRAQGELEDYLSAQGIPGFQCEDTREMTRIVRESGVINAIITDTPTLSEQQTQALQAYHVTGAVAAVTRERSERFSEGKRHVVLMDFGSKDNIARCLAERDCAVTIVPAHTPAAEIRALKPDGIMLSNGPGDPAENTMIIRTLAQLMGWGIPMFGICLGHQLMALAAGARTRKMKFGHRGANQPVEHVESGRVYVTSQNHGYCVVDESLGGNAKTLYRNVNDGTCEGIEYLHTPAFSVQFHPEACAGPLDSRFLFDEFIALMDKEETNHA